MLRLICAIFAIAMSGTAAAAERVLLSGGSVLDVREGRVLRNTDVLIEGDRILEVGRASRFDLSGDETIIDMDGAVLLPGLSDSHTHLNSRADVHGYRRLAVSDPRLAIAGVTNAEKTLLAGFTTVRNLGAPGYVDVALRDAINDGDIPGPRMLVSGPSIGMTGGHCDSNLLPFQYGVIAEGVADGPWAVRRKVRQNVKYGADVIKFCGTGGVLSKGTRIGAQQFTLEEMAALVDEAHLLGLKVAVHAHGADGIRTAIEAGVDSIEHSSLINDESIDLAVEQGIYLSMDIYVSDYILAEGQAAGILEESLEKERIVGKAQRERFQAAVDKGANIAFGSDAGVYPHGTNARQFKYMVDWGMTPAQAIYASTLGNATLFGLDADLGEVAPGKYADIIAVDGDPLRDVRELEDVDFVMKGGLVYLNAMSDG